MRSRGELLQVRIIAWVGVAVLLLLAYDGMSFVSWSILVAVLAVSVVSCDWRMRRVGVRFDDGVVRIQYFLRLRCIDRSDIVDVVLGYTFGRCTVRVVTRTGAAFELPGFVQGWRIESNAGETRDALAVVRRVLGFSTSDAEPEAT